MIRIEVEKFLSSKKPGEVDPPQVQALKGLIRRGEAKAAARLCGVPVEKLHFLDMPFYETGTVRKKPVGEEDIQIIIKGLNDAKELIADVMQELKANQVRRE